MAGYIGPNTLQHDAATIEHSPNAVAAYQAIQRWRNQFPDLELCAVLNLAKKVHEARYADGNAKKLPYPLFVHIAEVIYTHGPSSMQTVQRVIEDRHKVQVSRSDLFEAAEAAAFVSRSALDDWTVPYGTVIKLKNKILRWPDASLAGLPEILRNAYRAVLLKNPEVVPLRTLSMNVGMLGPYKQRQVQRALQTLKSLGLVVITNDPKRRRKLYHLPPGKVIFDAAKPES